MKLVKAKLEHGFNDPIVIASKNVGAMKNLLFLFVGSFLYYFLMYLLNMVGTRNGTGEVAAS